MPDITKIIESKIDYYEFFSQYCDKISKTEKDQYIGTCPSHEDKNPSFTFNTENGMWNCIAGCGNGNLFTFIGKKHNLPNRTDHVVVICKLLDLI